MQTSQGQVGRVRSTRKHVAICEEIPGEVLQHTLEELERWFNTPQHSSARHVEGGEIFD
jgi:hypothetical protein